MASGELSGIDQLRILRVEACDGCRNAEEKPYETKRYLGGHARYRGHVVSSLEKQFTEVVQTHAGQPGIQHFGILHRQTYTRHGIDRYTELQMARRVARRAEQLLSINDYNDH